VLAFSVWNALWVVFVSFLFVAILMMMFSVIVDLFRDDDLSGWAKAAWIVLLIILPLLGLLVYTIVRGKGMAEREMKSQLQAKEDFDAYVRQTAGAGSGAASELEKASNLHAEGRLSDDEYASLKAKILS